MWLVSGRTINHSTISNFRRKHKQKLKDIHRRMLRVAIDMGVAKLSELCIDGTSPDKLPPELAELTTRRTKMNEVLEQLREMDLGADFARNRIRDVDCGSILPDCPMPRTICVEHFVNPHTGRTCCQIITRK